MCDNVTVLTDDDSFKVHATISCYYQEILFSYSWGLSVRGALSLSPPLKVILFSYSGYRGYVTPHLPSILLEGGWCMAQCVLAWGGGGAELEHASRPRWEGSYWHVPGGVIIHAWDSIFVMRILVSHCCPPPRPQRDPTSPNC